MTIDLSYQDNVAVLTLSRPEILNAVDFAMAEDLLRKIEHVAQDDSVALVLTGAGRAFCAGSDLRKREAHPSEKLRLMHVIVERLIALPKLSVAAINGLALGGGLELALGCTLRIAHPSVQLGLPEIKIATMPSYGATQLLPRLIGVSRALSMMLRGDAIGADEALSIGLVTELADDTVSRAVALARSCSEGRQKAQLAIRRAVFNGLDLSLEAGLAHEQELALGLVDEPEVHAAIAAFFARSNSR